MALNFTSSGATTIRIPITGDTSGLERALNNATGELKGFGGRMRGTMRNIGGAFVAGFAGLQLAGLIGDSITDASGLEESANRAAEIFGAEFMSGLEAFAAGADTGLGLSERQVMDAASTFAIFGKSAGLSGENLVDFGTEMTTLAADMASFNNTSPDEAIVAIGAAMRGESEPIRKYGVLLDDATLKARALEMGLYDGEGALDVQTRALAASAEIMAQTTDQQGDFARTSSGLAGQQKILRAQLENVSAEIGQKLLPVAVALATWFNEEGLPAIMRFGGWLQDNIPPIISAVTGFFERHRDTIAEVFTTIAAVAVAAWAVIQAIIGVALEYINGIWNTFAGLFRGDWSQFWEGISALLSLAWEGIQAAFRLGFDVVKFLTGLAWEWIQDKFWESVDKIKETVSDGIDAVKTYFEELPGKILEAVGDLGMLLWDAGVAVLQGLWDGMKAKAQEVLDWVAGMAGNIAGAFADAIGIGSPSRVFIGFGENIVEGLQIGLEGGATPAVGTMTGVADSLTAPFAGGRSGATSMSGPGGMMTVVVELDGREIVRSIERVSERDGGVRIKTRAGG